MKTETLKKFYTKAIEAHHGIPKDGELESWQNVLGNYTESQLDAALRRWDRETKIEDYTGKPKGSRIPTPAELKLSMDEFEAASIKKFIPCTKCDEGWIRVYAGMTDGTPLNPRGNPIDPKFGALRRCECFLAWKRERKAA